MESRAREYANQLDRDQSCARLRSEPWWPDRRRLAWNSGQPRIQIIQSPAFTTGSFFEICDLQDKWLLYHSRIVGDGFPPMVCGYERVQFDSKTLSEFSMQLRRLTLPAAPPVTNTSRANGVMTQLTLFGDIHAQARFQWWSHYPPAWTTLVEAVDEMLAMFIEAAKPDSAGAGNA